MKQYPGILKSLALTFLLVQALSAKAQAVTEVSFGGKVLRLPIPQGMCIIPRNSEAGKPFYDLQEQGQAGLNKVAVLFADCGEWKMRERNAAYRIRRHGNVLLQLSKGGERLVPSEYNRNAFLRAIYKPLLESDNAEIEKDVNERFGRATASTVKITLSPKLSVIEKDDNAVYMAAASSVKYANEEAKVAYMIAVSLVRSVPISVNFYVDDTPDAVNKLLPQSKQAIKAMLAANPD